MRTVPIRLAVGMLAAAAVTAVPTVTPSPAAAAPSSTLSWGPCDRLVPEPGQLTCATLRVPLDHRHPGGTQITLTVSRLAAVGPGPRRGVLLVNPGGPGGSGLAMPLGLAGILSPGVRAGYDLIGFDPRGIGHSSPLTCGLPQAPPSDLVHPFPGPGASTGRNVAYARSTAAACGRHGGALLPHVGTAATARDMDLIRRALGERTIAYYGASYGGYLGAVYRQLFPRRGDRFILDSPVDPRRLGHRAYRMMSGASDARFADLAAWVAARHATYRLGATPAAVRARYLALAEALDHRPVPAPGGSSLTGAMFRDYTFQSLYRDGYFPTIAEIWQHAADHSARPATTPAAGSPAAGTLAAGTLAAGTLAPTGEPPAPVTPSAPAVPADNFVAALYALVCAEGTWTRDVAHYERAVAEDRVRRPVTAGMPANIWPCAFWTVRPAADPVRLTGGGRRNVLILRNAGDPATPGTGMRTVLRHAAAQVTIDAGGHGVLGNGTTCAHSAVSEFLIGGSLPGTDRRCPGPVG